jgi:SAM-dependent methyltransferase
MAMLVSSNASTQTHTIAELERRLQEFYDGNSSYYDVAAVSDKRTLIEKIFPYVEETIRRKNGRAKILEIGAGITQLPNVLKAHFGSDNLDITLHDINDTNLGFYAELGISNVMIGDLIKKTTNERYDLIVCFFVYEHVVRPAAFVDTAVSLLDDGGRFCIICPRYDIPGYVSPALRHRSVPSQIAGNLRILLSTLSARLLGRAAFLVEAEPAAFHRPWRRDYDAINMVSRADLVAHLGGRYRIEDLPNAPATDFKSWLFQKLQLQVVIDRR